MMNKAEAEEYIYRSYLKAAKFHDYSEMDATRRTPELTRQMIQKRKQTPCILVTGSKGKGSVANMIAAILQTKMCTGLMTSPHLIDFCERFRVNGEQMSEEDFLKGLEEIRPELDEIEARIPPHVCISPMGIQAVLALDYFRKKNTEFQVFECGKGARYDDVNNIPHEYAVINRIFLEHTRELGKTLQEIAFDKAHVITGEQTCVYVAEQEPEVMQIILERAERLHVPVKQYGVDFLAENIRYTSHGMETDVRIGEQVYRDLVIPLLGEHQAENLALALAAGIDIIEEIREIRELQDIRERLRTLRWPGRAEIIANTPVTILDACINRQSGKAMAAILEQMHLNHITLIAGIPDDKDYLGVVQSVAAYVDRVILTRSQNPHYQFTQLQQARLHEIGIQAEASQSVEEAVRLAKKYASPVLILGTTSVVAEVEQFYNNA